MRRKLCFTAAAGDSTFIATYRQAFIEASVGETTLEVTQATIQCPLICTEDQTTTIKPEIAILAIVGISSCPFDMKLSLGKTVQAF